MYEPDVLPLWVAEMDAAPAPAVVEALETARTRATSATPRSTTSYAESLRRRRRDGGGGGRSTRRPRTLAADVLTGVRAALTL